MKWLRDLVGAKPAKTPTVATSNPPAPAALGKAFDLEQAGDLACAEAAYAQLLQQQPAHAEALWLLGSLLRRAGRLPEAITTLQRAAKLQPRELPYLVELARAQTAARRYGEACETLTACVGIQADCIEVLNDLAGVLISLHRLDEAEPVLLRRARLLPPAPEVQLNLGMIYCFSGQADAAIACYREGLALAPDSATAYSNLLLQLNYSQREDAASIWAEHQRFGARFAVGYAAPLTDPTWPRPLRVGYISPDFGIHVVMRFMEGIFANHARSRVEVFCYHTHPHKDTFTAWLRATVPHWRDVDQLDAAALAETIRRDRIDILVDLAGHTAHNRLLTMALKPAPVQATYLGYPNTSGLGAIDWHISDAFADPPGASDRHSAERVLRLPGSYFCYRASPDAPAVNALPAAAHGTITFGCFNNLSKLSAGFLEAAAQVLHAVPTARLLMKNQQLSTRSVAAAVRASFERAGIDPQRLELRGWEASNQHHLAMYGAVDIALDSFPYNGATTTCEALWMGVPVVTLAGDRHAGRMGASILNAVGLGELVTTTPGQYAAVAARLAADPGSLQALRAGLRGRLQASCIMDEAGFTQRLEQAYAQIWEEHLRSRSAAAQSDAGLAGERLQRARALRAAGQLTEASDLCEAILRVEPAQPEALELRWDLAFDCGLPGIATDWLIRALAVRDAGKFHYMLGCVQQAQGQYQDATASFQRTLALEPGNARAHNNLGCLAEAGGQLPEAQAHYRMATEADPQLAPALYNLGNLHRQLAEPGAAIDIMRRALAIDGKHADWHCNLGALLLVRSELDAAADELRAAVAIDPGLVRAQQLLAALHWRCGRVAEALASLDTALRASEQADIASARLRILAWRDAEQPGVLQAAHRQWSERHALGVTRHGGSAGAGMRAPGARMTIGYLVPDESAHSLASHLLPLVAHHDRHQVDVIIYACGTLEEQLAADLRPHLRACRQLASLNDAEAARRMRADEVDVLVNLAGHDATGRMLLLASRPAPVQLPDLAGTMQPVGNECPLQLPGAGLCYAPHGDLANVALDGQRLAGPTVFGSVAPLAFASTQTLQLWAAALQAAPQARLLVVADGLQSQQCQDELLQRLGEQGIARERVTLRAPPQRRAAAFDGIDILLDSAPVNAVTAACDALWLGTPVLTLAGSVPAAQRVASLLRAAGQPHWVADSVGDFAAKAAQLAGSASQLRAQRSALRSSLGASTVMDAASCARQFESACRQLLAAAALPPEPAAAGVN